MTIEGKSYLIKDLNIECWEKDHIQLLLFYTLPIGIVWIFGYPGLIFGLLYKNRKNLDDKDTIVKYGLYYIGFKDETFYWQILVINFRRLLFTII